MAFCGMHRIVNNGNDIPNDAHTFARLVQQVQAQKQGWESWFSPVSGEGASGGGPERLVLLQILICFFATPDGRS